MVQGKQMKKLRDSHDSKIFEEAEKAGFDLNLIDLNLSLTPTQRVEQHQSALTLVLELEAIREAKEAMNRDKDRMAVRELRAIQAKNKK